jgi:type II secretory pathway pseudopilin PulG
MQCGMSLLYAMLTLVVLSFAAVALVRSVDTGTLVLGNLGFKQDATAAGDQATRVALQWLNDNPSLLNADSPANGYYASSLGNLDVTGSQSKLNTRALINWNNDGCAYASADSYVSGGCVTVPNSTPVLVGGNTARYVILRLCSDIGAPDTTTASGGTNTCLKTTSSATSSGGENGLLDYKHQRIPPSGASLNYRIVVQVQGARNTTSYTETIVHF